MSMIFLFQMSNQILKRFLRRDLHEKGRVQATRNKKAPGFGEKINSEENDVWGRKTLYR
jgi:hypothetical protein